MLRPTPEPFQKIFGTNPIAVLSLVKDPAAEHQPGWISYHQELDECPDVEIISGGLNERQVGGAALWRQGNLFHFAFDLSPSDMNETGQALLLNALVYITRFTEDRPIARTPSVFAEKDVSPRDKHWLEILFAPGSKPPALDTMKYLMAPETITTVQAMGSTNAQQWFKEYSSYLTCAEDGKLMVDKAAKNLSSHFDQPEFFEKTIALLDDQTKAAEAQKLLARYAPQGPANGTPALWRQWWLENRPYLFYATSGGYRWYIDPLAKRRSIPSEKLRGPARASVP